MEAEGSKSLEDFFFYDEAELSYVMSVTLTIYTNEFLVRCKYGVGLLLFSKLRIFLHKVTKESLHVVGHS